MTILSRLRSAITRLGQSSPLTPSDLAPTPPAPVLSCLVRGLIRSIQTETAQWEDSWVGHLTWRHTTTGFAIREGYSFGSDPASLHLESTTYSGGTKATKDEATALRDAIDECLLKPRVAEANRQIEAQRAKDAIKAVPIVARFEALGCGPQTMPNPEAAPVVVAPLPRRRRRKTP